MQGVFSNIGNYYALIKMEKENKKKTRQYCSKCYNFCGKIFNGHKIFLHRFPANPYISKVWTQRVTGIMKSPFTPHQNSRLCCALLEGQVGPNDKVNVPSLFGDKTFKICLVSLKCFFLFLILTHRCQSQRSMWSIPTINVVNPNDHRAFQQNLNGPNDSINFAVHLDGNFHGNAHEIPLFIQCSTYNHLG